MSVQGKSEGRKQVFILTLRTLYERRMDFVFVAAGYVANVAHRLSVVIMKPPGERVERSDALRLLFDFLTSGERVLGIIRVTMDQAEGAMVFVPGELMQEIVRVTEVQVLLFNSSTFGFQGLIFKRGGIDPFVSA